MGPRRRVELARRIVQERFRRRFVAVLPGCQVAEDHGVNCLVTFPSLDIDDLPEPAHRIAATASASASLSD